MTLLTSLNFLLLRVVCRWTCMHVLILPPGPINIPTSYSRTSFIRVKLRALHSLWEQSGQDIKKNIYICIGPLDKSHKPHSTFKNGIDAVLAMLSLFFFSPLLREYLETHQTDLRKGKHKEHLRTCSAYARLCTSVRQELRRVFKVKLDVCLLFLYTTHCSYLWILYYREGMQIRTSAQHR